MDAPVSVGFVSPAAVALAEQSDEALIVPVAAFFAGAPAVIIADQVCRSFAAQDALFSAQAVGLIAWAVARSVRLEIPVVAHFVTSESGTGAAEKQLTAVL